MPSELETPMETIKSVFCKYASREGDKDKLNKEELKELLQNELGDLLKNPRDPKVVDKIMRDLDEDDDAQLDFKEFVMLVSTVLIKINLSFSGDT